MIGQKENNKRLIHHHINQKLGKTLAREENDDNYTIKI